MSTQTSSGYNLSKPSSRVLARPGGKQNFNIFGGPDHAPATKAKPKPKPAQSAPKPTGVAGARTKARSGGKARIQPAYLQNHKSALPTSQAPSSFPSSQPKPKPQPKPARAKGPKKYHSSTRVTHQPGGNTSINLFGGSSAPSAQSVQRKKLINPGRPAQPRQQQRSQRSAPDKKQAPRPKPQAAAGHTGRVVQQSKGAQTHNIFGGSTYGNAQAKPSTKTSVRLHNPPGGRSNTQGLF